MNILEPGMMAPLFTLTNQDGKKVSLKDFKGKRLALFFLSRRRHPNLYG
jgi:peroxiredoxin Q/BCP